MIRMMLGRSGLRDIVPPRVLYAGPAFRERAGLDAAMLPHSPKVSNPFEIEH